ncbi:MAG: RIP metalloprotease RseP [Deltaproteobacteria bacterium]|nr:RIP metalloprotease RseP [Deltaproteobacteria bacterium]
MSFLSAFLLIGILVAIHEFGHFIVAKLCGVHCTVFSIGYGKRLVGFEWKGTDYRLSALPFGGYVQMAGTDIFGVNEDEEEPEDDENGFMKKSVWARIAIVFAGPIFNLILPIVVFTGLYMAGDPQPAPVVGMVDWDSSAQSAGLLPNDEIRSLNGVKTESWLSFVKLLKELPSGQYPLSYIRKGEEKTVSVEVKEDAFFGVSAMRTNNEIGVDDPASPAGLAGLRTFDRIISINDVKTSDFVAIQQELIGKDSVRVEYARMGQNATTVMKRNSQWIPKINIDLIGVDTRWGLLSATLFIDDVSETVQNEGLFSGCTSAPPPASPAMVEGIEAGDRLVRIDGDFVRVWGDIPSYVSKAMIGEGDSAEVKTLSIDIIRQGSVVSLDIKPKVVQDTDGMGRYRFRPILGIRRGGGYEEGPKTRVYTSFLDSIDRASRETVMISGFIIEQLGKLITGEAAVEKSLGGPVEIFVQAEKAAQQGIFEWARLMALMSISLGIINLVPVPVLDGGQLLFFFIEGIRGKPVSLKMREYAMQIGVIFMALLMLFVLFFDIARRFGG